MSFVQFPFSSSAKTTGPLNWCNQTIYSATQRIECRVSGCGITNILEFMGPLHIRCCHSHFVLLPFPLHFQAHFKLNSHCCRNPNWELNGIPVSMHKWSTTNLYCKRWPHRLCVYSCERPILCANIPQDCSYYCCTERDPARSVRCQRSTRFRSLSRCTWKYCR